MENQASLTHNEDVKAGERPMDIETRVKSMEGTVGRIEDMMTLFLAASKLQNSPLERDLAPMSIRSSGLIAQNDLTPFLAAITSQMEGEKEEVQIAYPPQPQQSFQPTSPCHYQHPQTSQRRSLTPLYQPLSVLLPRLLEGKWINLINPRPVPNPLPLSVKTNESCAYHQGPGHSTDNCIALRHKVQDLIDYGIDIYGPPRVTCFPVQSRHPSRPQKYTPVPQCPRNPQAPRRVFSPIPWPLFQILPHLIEQRKIILPEPHPLPNPLPATYRINKYCAYHQQFGYTTNSCFNLKHEVQDLVEAGQVVFSQQPRSLGPMGVQGGSSSTHTPFHQGQVNGTKFMHQGHQLVAPITLRGFQVPSTSSAPMFNPKAGNHKLNALNRENFEEIIYTPLVGRAPEHPKLD